MNITIGDIECQTSVTYFSRGAAAIDSYPAEDAAIGFCVLDSKGQPAPWLLAKMSNEEVHRIEAELLCGLT